MSQSTDFPASKSDGLSMSQAIRIVIGWWRFALSKWQILLIAGILGALLGLTLAWRQKPKYSASLTFIVEDTKSGGLLGSYSGIASQFGIDLGNGSSSGVFSGDNVLQFLQSRLMVQQTLLSDTVWDGRKMTLADIFINTYQWNKAWKDKPELSNFSFPLNASWSSLTRLQDSVMGLLYDVITKSILMVSKPDKKLDFVEVRAVSLDETFSKLFTERLVDAATDFYVLTKTQRSREIVNKLQAQADSILQQLNKSTIIAANVKDLNLNPAKQITTISSTFATRDQAILMTMYAEVVKNLEISKTTLGQDTPIIQVVDSPIFPLKKIKFGRLMGLIIGGFLGGIATFCMLYFRKLYKEMP